METIANLFESVADGATVDRVYGDPVEAEGHTVVPVARIAYGVGSGYGTSEGADAKDGDTTDEEERSEGWGGGGGLVARPVGALEIGPGGTRFLRFGDRRRLAGAALLALLVGYLLGRRS
jgi:uncharacterized spore protein YtfJ